jgi:hypothetical protein
MSLWHERRRRSAGPEPATASLDPVIVALRDRVSFETRLAQTIAWCGPRASAADPGASLRSEEIDPGQQTVLGDNRGQRVQFVCYRRPSVLAASARRDAGLSMRDFDPMAAQSAIPATDAVDVLAGGRLLVYFPDEQLADGAAEAETRGFFDADNVPPWDTWVGLYADEREEEHLVSWVPATFIESVARGIWVNPEECIRWLDESDVPVTRALRLHGLLA